MVRLELLKLLDPLGHLLVGFDDFCEAIFCLYFYLIYFTVDNSDSFGRKAFQSIEKVNWEVLTCVQVQRVDALPTFMVMDLEHLQVFEIIDSHLFHLTIYPFFFFF